MNRKLLALFIVALAVLPFGIQAQAPVPGVDRLATRPLDMRSLELGLPSFGWQLEDAKDAAWLFQYLQTKDPAAAAAGVFDNGGIPIGRSGEAYARGIQRLTITSEHQLRRDRPTYAAVINAAGELTAIRPTWAAGTGYPANLEGGRVTIHPLTGLNVDKDSVTFRTDARGTITSFTGLPLKGPFDPAHPPIIVVAAPPLPAGQKELLLDLSSVCLARESPDGYYPANGSYLYGLYVSGHTGRNQVQHPQRAYYGSLVVEVRSSDPDKPRGVLWLTTADDPANRTGGHAFRLGIGEGTFAHGQQDPGAGNAAFVGVFASELVKTPLVQFQTVEFADLPPPERAGMIAFIPSGAGTVRPVYSNGKQWLWLR